MSRATKIDQWVSDAWLAGIPECELHEKMLSDGYSDEVIFAAIDVYEDLDRWHEKSLLRLQASCSDWREF